MAQMGHRPSQHQDHHLSPTAPEHSERPDDDPSAHSAGFAVGILSHFFPPDIGGISRLHSYTVDHYPRFGVRPVVLAGAGSPATRRHDYPVVRSPHYSRAFEVRRDIRQGRYGEEDPFEKAGWAELIDGLGERFTPFFAEHGIALVNSHVFSDLCVGQHIARRLDVPHVHIGHASYRSESYLRAESKRVRSRAPFLTQEYVSRVLRTSPADVFVVHSEHVRDKYLAIGVDPDRLTVLPPAVDLSTFRPDPAGAALLRRRLDLDGRLLITCPTLRKGGFETLLAAFALFVRRRHRDVVLLCCDSHDVGEDHQRMVKDVGLGGQVLFTSFSPQSMPAVYTASDLVVMCSIEEGIGLPALEARACGTPVIAHRFGPFLEFVEHGVDGMLVEREDPAALADTMALLLDDARLRRDLADAGAARVRHYSHAHLAARYLEVFRRVLSG